MKLSVAIITYNHEPFIRQAIESALAQRVDCQFEIVIGEDCSTDGTREIVLELCRRYPDRIVPLLRDRNVGGAQNLKEVLQACRGEYIALLEGDDYWTRPNKLQQQLDFLDRQPDFAICCHRAKACVEAGAGSSTPLPSPEQFKAGSYTIEDLLGQHFIYTCTVMYRSKAVCPVPDWLASVTAGDWARNIMAARWGKIQLMDEVMAAYRTHPHGMWSTKPLIHRLEQTAHTLEEVDRQLDFQYSAPIARTLADIYFEMATVERENGNRAAIMKNLMASARSAKLQPRGGFIAWTSLLGYGLLGIRRLRWWKH